MKASRTASDSADTAVELGPVQGGHGSLKEAVRGAAEAADSIVFAGEAVGEAEDEGGGAVDRAADGAAGSRQTARQKVLCSMTISSSCEPVSIAEQQH